MDVLIAVGGLIAASISAFKDLVDLVKDLRSTISDKKFESFVRELLSMLSQFRFGEDGVLKILILLRDGKNISHSELFELRDFEELNNRIERFYQNILDEYGGNKNQVRSRTRRLVRQVVDEKRGLRAKVTSLIAAIRNGGIEFDKAELASLIDRIEAFNADLEALDDTLHGYLEHTI